MKKSAPSLRKTRPPGTAHPPETVGEAAGAYATTPVLTKTFRVGGSQAVRLPKAYRLPDGEVVIEKRGDEIVLKAAPAQRRLSDKELLHWVKDLHTRHGKPTAEWPDIVRPGPEANRPMKDLEW